MGEVSRETIEKIVEEVTERVTVSVMRTVSLDAESRAQKVLADAEAETARTRSDLRQTLILAGIQASVLFGITVIGVSYSEQIKAFFLALS